MKSFIEHIKADVNVLIAVRDVRGQLVDKVEVHNIFVDQGRQWLAALSAGDSVFSHSHPPIVAYMGFGKGGALQDVPAERTAQTENSGVTSMATLVDILVTPTNLAAVSHTILTPPTSVRFTRLLTQTEVSYVPGPDSVPLSECGLFIRDKALLTGFPAHPDVDIAATVPTPTLVAYAQFRTLTKTQDVTIQFDWELRF
jgi:hypothetical protein